MPEKTYAAVDIGASSGRVVLGCINDDGAIELREMHRFDNVQEVRNGHDCWKLDMIFDEIVEGLTKCKDAGFEPVNVGIDTWAVDFVLLDENNEVIGDSVAYRDKRTKGMYEVADAIMDPLKVYELTGIQRQPFNTIYQLLALKQEHPEQLEAARMFLMVPDYLGYRLTGEEVNEYTNATTTGLLNARTQDWDPTIIEAFGFPADIFLPPTMPGAVVGPLPPQEAEQFFDRVDVNLDRFLSPASMIDEIRHCCGETGCEAPSTVGELMRCVYLSLSACYARSIEEMTALTGKTYTSLNIVGGGCQDAYLNQLTANACGIPVFAGPIEGTSLGNLAVQMIADGVSAGVQDFRDTISRSFPVNRFDLQEGL